MKRFKLPFLMFIILAAACTKEYTRVKVPANAVPTNDEAAAMVSTTLAANSNGLSEATADMMLHAQHWGNTNVSCGSTIRDTVLRQNPSGSSTIYNYKSIYSYTLLCNGSSQADSASSTLTYNGSFNGPNMASTNSGSSVFTLSGLLSSANSYVLNGEYKRNGTFNSKIGNKTSDTTNVDVVFKNLNLNKRTGIITGGNANITVSGSSAQKGTFNYAGTLVYNGDGTATLTINSTIYIVNLLTGEVRKK